MPKLFKKKFLFYFILSLIYLIIFILCVEGKPVNKKTLSEKNYFTKINIYILKNGDVRIEQNIELLNNYYSTYFLYNPSEVNKTVTYENIKNVKVYYNNKQLKSTKNTNGYFNYRRSTKSSTRICDPEAAESNSSIDPFNNIEIFLPQSSGKLKIVYELKNYVVNYNDIDYFEYNFKYGYNIFHNDAQINIIMPEYTNKFLVNTNLEFAHRSVVESLNSTTKQISLSGLQDNIFHMDVLFDKQICKSDLNISENKYDYLLNKAKQNKKDRFYLYLVMFLFYTLASVIITLARILHRSYKFK